MAKAVWLPPRYLPDASALVTAGYHPVAASLLASRGVTTPDVALDFTDPILGMIHKPRDLPDIQQAVGLLKQAIAEGWRVRLITDYDVDGQTAGALFLSFLREEYRLAGHDPELVDCQTPDRFAEGYGLNENHILMAAMDDVDLLMTFDCGIRSHKEGDLARKMGMRLIITDHHEPDGDLIPHADAVINPKRKDSRYPFKGICGCVVALKVAWAIKGSLRALLPYFDLAAVATLADRMPMVDENRAIVRFGLAVLNGEEIVENGRVIHSAPRRPAFALLAGEERVSETDIDFKIAPMINSIGRMGDANRGVSFLLETDPVRLEEMRVAIEADNELRKEIQEQVIKTVCEAIGDANPPAIVYCDSFAHLGKNAPKVDGVVGIAAAKVGELYHCPTIILVKHGNMARGSARAIIDVNLYEALMQVNDLFDQWGGHHAAAGMSLPVQNVPQLREHLERVVTNLDPTITTRRIQVDAVIGEDELKWTGSTYPIIEIVDLLRPFGNDNPEPIFQINGAIVTASRTMGKENNHLKLTLQVGDACFDAICWRGAKAYKEAGCPSVIDFVGTASLNVWKGRSTLQFIIQDWRPTEVDF